MPATKALWIAIAVINATFTACTQSKGKSFVPALPGYNDQQHEVLVLKKKLLEISGLVYLGDTKFAAINDENGVLFITDLSNDSTTTYKFKGKGDYEELVKVDSTYYVLESSGDIIEIKPPYTENQTYKFHEKKIEFESLVHYPDQNKLVLITKDQKKRSDGIKAYAFDLATKEFETDPIFTISFKQVFTILTNYNTECKPSAAAINPVNQRLYIIASVGKVLLECEKDGKLLNIYKINPAHFPQPEGISFAKNGDMYISNEGAAGKATILKFPYAGKK